MSTVFDKADASTYRGALWSLLWLGVLHRTAQIVKGEENTRPTGWRAFPMLNFIGGADGFWN
jgi:hypothetical protein